MIRSASLSPTGPGDLFGGKFKRQSVQNKSVHSAKITKQHPLQDFNNFWANIPQRQ
jgi:hypothetical protein